MTVAAFRPRALVLFAALAMCYGWGWRGVYGHEAGAMLPGALLALTICLASGRPDWYRRGAVAGLCGAIGWAWGGTLTNMEHRLYILSDTPVDVIYGFACIGLVGLLWSGVGGACLALAFTHPRSALNRFIGPLTALGASFFALRVYFSLFPGQRAAYWSFTNAQWHGSEWLAALTAVAVMLPYWLVRKRERPASGLLLACALAWWIGYLALTRFGGIELAPPYRSESWGGVVGILVALLTYHVRRHDRAAVLFTLYAMLAGCIGFILALQIHVPFVMGWGYFSDVSPWKIAEESFGFFMGLGVAVGAGRLLSGGLAAPPEDDDRGRLDTFAAFVLLVVMMWMNLIRSIPRWRDRYFVLPEDPFSLLKPPFPQLEAWHYFLAVGLLWTALVLYCIFRARWGDLPLSPKTAVEKTAALFVFIVVVSMSAMMTLGVPDWKRPSALFSAISMIALAGVIVWLALAHASRGLVASSSQAPAASPSDTRWQVGWKYWALWAWVPVHVLLASAIALYIVDAPWRQDQGLERHRFGPNATWRLELQRQEAKAARPGTTAGPVDLTDPEQVEARRPLLIAHRGGIITSGTPAGSLGAIRLARGLGYALVELDIQESRDHVPIVFHDRTLEGSCGRPGTVADFDSPTLKSILYTGTVHRIATLRQALELCQAFGLGVLLDIQTEDGSEAFFRMVVEIIAEFGLESSTMTISRAPTIREHLTNLLHPIDEEQIARAGAGTNPSASLDGQLWIGLPEDLPGSKVVRLRELGVLVIATVTRSRYPDEQHEGRARKDIRRLRSAGVDGFLIDSVYQGEFGIRMRGVRH